MKSAVIGVDVGGTNTDVAILETNTNIVLAWSKSPTTRDVTSGIINAIRQATNSLHSNSTTPHHISCVMIGTTQFMNAVIERSSDLSKVGVIRLCGPTSRTIEPFATFGDDMKRCMMGHKAMVSGGYEYDVQELSQVQEEEIVREAQLMKEKGITQVVVNGVFSPLSSKQEQDAADIISRVYPEADITIASKIANMGMLERENAAILNASLKPFSRRTLVAFRKALHVLGLDCPFYLTQNDGTVLSSKEASESPVRTIGSGPTNSIRGAAFLANLKDGIVVDIGGTTTDVGCLVNGFPRLSQSAVELGGIRTNFMIPDTFSYGLGGGSIVSVSDADSEIKIGPQSVGYELSTKAKVFGGNVLTTTDIAVASGIASIGDVTLVQDLSQSLLSQTRRQIRETIEYCIEQVKTRKELVPVILVGGGSILIEKNDDLFGASQIIKPDHFLIANAVGAAIAQVSGVVDVLIQIGENQTREEVLERVKNQATEIAYANGAVLGSVAIIELEQIDIAYSMGRAIRFIVKAVGDLDHNRVEHLNIADSDFDDDLSFLSSEKPLVSTAPHKTPIDLTKYTPNVVDKEWHLTEIDIDFISIGAGVIGSGGGGNTLLGTLAAKELLKAGKQMRVIDLDSMPEDAFAYSMGQMGAPSVCDEKLLNPEDGIQAIAKLQKYTQQTCYAISIAEIGGQNAIVPLLIGAVTGYPVLDLDQFGRAFPELQMCIPYIYSAPPVPAILSETKGNQILLTDISRYRDPYKEVENYLRVIVTQMGCSALVIFPPISKPNLPKYSAMRTLSQSWHIGRSVFLARQMKEDPVDAIVKAENGVLLYQGKIIDVSRQVDKGFTKGRVIIQGLNTFDGSEMFIDFQNEYLIAVQKTQNSSKVLATVPDILSIVSTQDAEPVFVESLKFGLRVSVICLPVSPVLTTERAISIVGPQMFGYKDQSYTSTCPGYKEPVSVIAEYAIGKRSEEITLI